MKDYRDSCSGSCEALAESIKTGKDSPPIVLVWCKPRVCAGHSKNLQFNSFRVLVIVITYLAYVSFHACRRPLPTVKKALTGKVIFQHGDTNVSFGFQPFNETHGILLFSAMDSVWTLFYGLCMFATAQIAEVVNTRQFLVAGLLGTSFSTIMFGLGKYIDVHGEWYYMLLTMLNAMCQSIGWPCCMSIMISWFQKKGHGGVMGLWNTHQSVGNFVGQYLSAYFLKFDWPIPFIVNGTLASFASFLVILFLPHTPSSIQVEVEDEQQPDENCDEVSVSELVTPTDKTSLIQSRHSITLTDAFNTRGVMEYSLCLLFAKVVLYTFVFWLPFYIQEQGIQGEIVTSSTAGYLSMWFDVGSVIGGFTSGFLSDFTGGCNATLCIIFEIFAVISLLVYKLIGKDSIVNTIVMLILIGASTNGCISIIKTAVTADLAGRAEKERNVNAKSIVAGLVDGIGTIGGMFGPILVIIINHFNMDYLMYALCASSGISGLCLVILAINEVKVKCGRYKPI